MQSFDLEASQEQAAEVPVLARVWHEDGVWNVSAFDLPIVAYADDLEEARSNFQEAVLSHFETLAHVGMLESNILKLQALALERGFWEERAKPRELVERFTFPAGFKANLCSAPL